MTRCAEGNYQRWAQKSPEHQPEGEASFYAPPPIRPFETQPCTLKASTGRTQGIIFRIRPPTIPAKMLVNNSTADPSCVEFRALRLNQGTYTRYSELNVSGVPVVKCLGQSLASFVMVNEGPLPSWGERAISREGRQNVSFTVDFETSLESLADRFIMRLKSPARCRLTHLCPFVSGFQMVVSVLGWSRNSRSSWGSLRTFGSISPDRFLLIIGVPTRHHVLGKHRATLDSHRYSYRLLRDGKRLEPVRYLQKTEKESASPVAGQATVSLAELARLFYRYLEFNPTMVMPGRAGWTSRREAGRFSAGKGTWEECAAPGCSASTSAPSFSSERQPLRLSRLLSLPQFSFVNFS